MLVTISLCLERLFHVVRSPPLRPRIYRDSADTQCAAYACLKFHVSQVHSINPIYTVLQHKNYLRSMRLPCNILRLSYQNLFCFFRYLGVVRVKLVFSFCIFAKLSLLLHRKPANEGWCPRIHSGLHILIAFIDALRLTKRKLRNFSNTVKIKVSNRCLFDMTSVMPHSAVRVWYVVISA